MNEVDHFRTFHRPLYILRGKDDFLIESLDYTGSVAHRFNYTPPPFKFGRW